MLDIEVDCEASGVLVCFPCRDTRPSPLRGYEEKRGAS